MNRIVVSRWGERRRRRAGRARAGAAIGCTLPSRLCLASIAPSAVPQLLLLPLLLRLRLNLLGCAARGGCSCNLVVRPRLLPLQQQLLVRRELLQGGAAMKTD